MGCSNGVMVQIGRIAKLHEQKTQAIQEVHFNEIDFNRNVNDISRDIQFCVAQECLGGLCLAARKTETPTFKAQDSTSLVTRLFTHMASIYLYLVAHGFQNLELLGITTSMSEVKLIQTGIPSHLLPSLIPPLFFIGCVAKQDDEPFFRTLFSTPPLLDSLFPRRQNILPILEDVWRKRRTVPDFSWSDCLDLGHSTGMVLL